LQQTSSQLWGVKNDPGQFYFDKTAKTLYYYIRPGENMDTADVEAPVVEKLIDIAGTSTTNRVKNITFQGITFANTDYTLLRLEVHTVNQHAMVHRHLSLFIMTIGTTRSMILLIHYQK
jgi:hypothetical protein